MGFYSIYKIIKDMLRTLFGNKFIKILIIFLLFNIILIVYSKCYALSTIPPIIVNGVTFDFSSTVAPNKWYSDHPAFTGNMDNITIFRYEKSNNQYLYVFTRSSYPIYITTTNSGNYTITRTFSYNEQGNNTYYMYNRQSVARSSTSVSAGSPSFGSGEYFTTQYDSYNPSTLTVLYSNQDVYLNNEKIYSNYINPTLGNSLTDLENLNFSNFVINANSYTDEIENNDGTLYMLFYNKSLDKTTVDYLYPIKEKGFTKGSIYTDYENSTSDNMVFSFPLFMSGVFFNVGSTYQIRFAKMNYNSEYGIMTYEYLGEPYTFTISSNVTQDYINQLNQQTATSTDSETTQELQNSINQQTQSINDINNSINDSTVDSSSINLPTDTTNDPTQSGVDNIFQTIYNSFTSGTPQDIVFPLPFSNNNLTINPNYVSNMLGSTQRR